MVAMDGTFTIFVYEVTSFERFFQMAGQTTFEVFLVNIYYTKLLYS
jgi:hypothetical protein